MDAVDTQAVSDLRQFLVCSLQSLVDTNRCVSLICVDHCLHLCLRYIQALDCKLGCMLQFETPSLSVTSCKDSCVST